MQPLIKRLLGASCLLLATGLAEAAPIHYQFSGTEIGEYTGTGAPVSVNPIYASPSLINGDFYYDSAAPEVGVVPVAGYGGALFTTYSGAFTDFDLSVNGQSASADLGAGLVGDNVVPTGVGVPLDVLLGYSANDPSTGFSGFQVGDWNLSSFAFVFFNNSATFNQDDLPADVISNLNTNLLELFFTNDSGDVQKVRYNLSIAEAVDVPEPASALLFGLGIAGLLIQRRKTQRR